MQIPHGHTYVIPSSAVPFVGGRLDLSLFDAQRAVRRGDQRLAVRIAHTGRLARIPGIRVTSDTGRVARGYLTRGSAKTFGAALADDPGAALGEMVSTISLPGHRPCRRRARSAIPCARSS